MWMVSFVRIHFTMPTIPSSRSTLLHAHSDHNTSAVENSQLNLSLWRIWHYFTLLSLTIVFVVITHCKLLHLLLNKHPELIHMLRWHHVEAAAQESVFRIRLKKKKIKQTIKLNNTKRRERNPFSKCMGNKETLRPFWKEIARNAKNACNFCFAQAAAKPPPHNQPSGFRLLSHSAVQEIKSHDSTLDSSHVQAQQQCGTAVPATHCPQRIRVSYKSAKVNSKLFFSSPREKQTR